MIKTKLLTNYLYLTAAVFLFGFLVFGAELLKRSGFSLIEILIIPYVIVCLTLFPFVYKYIKFFHTLPKWVLVVYPIICLFAMVGQYAPLFMGVSVSLVVFLLSTQPIWTILISVLFLGARLTKAEAFSILVSIVGLVLLLMPEDGLTYSIAGVSLAIMGAVCISAWVLFSSYMAKRGITPMTQTFFTNLYNFVPLVILYPLLPKWIPDPAITGFSLDKPFEPWIGMCVYALVVFIIAYLLFYKAASKVKAIHLGLILLLEPVIGAFLDTTFLGTHLTAGMFAGGALIIIANAYLVISSVHKRDDYEYHI